MKEANPAEKLRSRVVKDEKCQKIEEIHDRLCSQSSMLSVIACQNSNYGYLDYAHAYRHMINTLSNVYGKISLVIKALYVLDNLLVHLKSFFSGVCFCGFVISCLQSFTFPISKNMCR